MKGLQWTLLGVLCCAGIASSITREYFFAIKEIEWDYAPSGKNLIQNKTIKEDEEARVFLERGEQRIGRVYKKAVYLQYTDATYRQEIEKPKWLGYLGPLISAEEDDIVIVHLKNMAKRPYSIHAHGLSYNKSSEGALYPDSSEKVEKADDSVAPEKSFTYIWTLPASHTPGKDDTNCLTRIYHSHVNAPKDIASGLIGPLIICKKGSLDVHGDKTGDYLYTLMFTVSDENLSWYLDENIKTYCTAPAKVNKDDEGFQESNKMHSINGYVYGNLPDLSMCMGNKIHWHLFGMGNEVDIHSAFFHGQILTDKRHHVNTVSLFPATFVNVEMVADNPGQWLLSCQVNDHLEAIFEIKKCFPNVHKPRPFGEVRQYYIAAEEVIWDYGPTGINQYSGMKLADDSKPRLLSTKSNIESRSGINIAQKCIFQSWLDSTNQTNQSESMRDQIVKEVVCCSSLSGVVEPLPAALVRPDTTYQYEWVVPKDGGPTEKDPDCITYMYYSAVDPIKDTNSGLVGPLLICKPKTLKSGKQKNVDKEFHLLATVFDENLSWYLDDNINRFAKQPKSVKKDDEDFQESNKMHSLNGYMYGNLKGFTMCKGDKVSWHLSGLGSEVDIHGLYFEGNRFLYKDTRRDTINVFPHISHTVLMEPDSMGTFEVGCKTTDHYHGGMRANYTVEKCRFWNRQSETMLHQSKYYIAAVEMDWDYSPTRTWEEEMHHSLKDSPGNEFLKKEGKFIGSKYKKVLYREYTDETFTKPKERSADMEHLGIMGPMIHGKVGEKVKIVFKNMAKRPYSIHAHGVKTDSPQVALTHPGETKTYTWYLPKNSGPTEEQEECSVGAYYSTVDVIKDMYSGLIGPLVICKKSLARTLGLKKEIEEFALLFMVFDENESWYLDDNIKAHVKIPPKALKEDEEFIESNKMHGINGLVYGNLKGLNMKVGDKVYWYLMGMGNEVDIHTAHFHGHSFDYKVIHPSPDVFDLFPGTFQTVTMRPQYSGTWLLHCHVTDHIQAGMETTYTVLEKDGEFPCL
uniref:ferroxidase n=1 Tax=Cyprinus carpio TaxID=7962 RepID=A0A8C2F9V6_CYPCA